MQAHRRTGWQSVVGDRAGYSNGAVVISSGLARTGAYDRRLVLVDRTFTILVGGEDVVNLLPIQGPIIEADLVEHPGVRRALSLHVAEVKVVAGLRREASEIALGLENAIDVELRYPARLIISKRIMAPHSAGPVAQVLLEGRDLVADSIGIDKRRAQIALEVTLPLVEVSPPRAPVVPPYQHR